MDTREFWADCGELTGGAFIPAWPRNSSIFACELVGWLVGLTKINQFQELDFIKTN